MRSKRRPPPISSKTNDLRTNRRIRIPRVVVIDDHGENLGEMDTQEALKMAVDAGLDLVEVSPQARPPVCKIMNYGQYKYAQKKRQKNNKAHQSKVKGVRLHPGTAENDIQVAMKKAKRFLERGDKVQVMVWFKGREMAHKDRGEEMCKRFIKDLNEISKIESNIRMEGRRMHLLLTPLTQEEKNRIKKDKEKREATASAEAENK